MLKLQKGNVIKIVDSSLKRDKLIDMGFAIVQTPIEFEANQGEENTKDIKSKGKKTPSKTKGD